MNLPDTYERIASLRDWQPVRELRRAKHGATCLIRHQATGAEGVLKWLRFPASSGTARQLLAEVTAMRALSALPQIAAIHDVATRHAADGQLDVFIRMEALTPLSERLQRTPLTLDSSVHLVCDMAEALKLCHAAGLVHGNLKPGNILCTASGHKLSDPGVALNQLRLAVLEEADPCCQPPEQRSGQPASPLWDVYGLGMTLYLLLNEGMLPGQTRPGADAGQAAARRLLSRDARSEEALPPPAHAPEALAAVVLRAISADPAQRHASVSELYEAYAQAVAGLAPAQRSAVAPASPTPAKPAASDAPAGRKSPRAALLAFAAALLVLIGALAVVPALHPDEETPVVEPTATATATATPTVAPPTMELSAEVFSAHVTISGLDAETVDATLCEAGAAAGRSVILANGLNLLEGLAPDTAYTLTLSGKHQQQETTFRTGSASTGLFQPKNSWFLAITDLTFLGEGNPAAIINKKFNATNQRFSVKRDAITLSLNAASSQMDLILYCRATAAGELQATESPQHYLVLKAGSAVIVQQARYAPLVASDGSYYAYHNFSPLLDEYYARYGTNPSGPVTFQVYWQGEMVCDTQLTVNAANP